mgnify:CR=1 FL=1
MAEETTPEEVQAPQPEQSNLPVNEVTGRPITQDSAGNPMINSVTGRAITKPRKGGSFGVVYIKQAFSSTGCIQENSIKAFRTLSAYGSTVF